MIVFIGLGIAVLLGLLSIFFALNGRGQKKSKDVATGKHMKPSIPAIWSIPGEITEVSKPWGKEVIWAKTERYVGKVLHINAGHQLSKQYHEKKDESIFILAGRMELELEYDTNHLTLPMNPGDCIHIPPRVIHRMVALTDVQVAEVSTPELWDVVRLEDSYGRVKS